MGQPIQTDRADLFAKSIGSDNDCDVYFAICKVSKSSGRARRAPRVGLLGGRRKRHSTIDRFWARVQKNPDGCWVFTGAKCCPGGHIYFAREDGSRVSAHRFSYELHIGPIPPGMVVMHSCDVARCVNPAHLSAGTQRDNVRDAIDKGRFAPWEHPNTIAAKRQRALKSAPTGSEQADRHAHVTNQAGDVVTHARQRRAAGTARHGEPCLR